MNISAIFKISLALLCIAVFPVSLLAKETSAKPFTIVIDAGHGGKDVGAMDNGAMEKKINLGVALRLEELIKKKLKDVKVVMTRSDDTYLTLQQRADIANKAKGDLFISIHTNSLDKSNKNRANISGSSVYALGLHKNDNNKRVAQRENSVIELESNFEQKYKGFDPNKDESYIIFEMAQSKDLAKSLKFAHDVQKELVGIGRNNRGVHQAGFWVLWATSMPAVLVELDFICNPGAAQYMTSSKGEEEFAQAIFKAVDTYYSNWGKNKRQSTTLRAKSETAKKGSIAKANERKNAVSNKGGVSSKEVMQPESTILQDELVSSAVMASSESRKKKTHIAPAVNKRQSSNAKRRRRGESAREASMQRNVETAMIPLYSEKDRLGKNVTFAYNDAASSQTNALSEKERKRLEKQAKKEQKEKEKRRKDEEKRKRKENAHNAKVGKIVTVYKIQILASADLLKQNNPRFQGLSPITAFKENNLYKYCYGESTNRAEMETMLSDVRKKFPDAFVVASSRSGK